MTFVALGIDAPSLVRIDLQHDGRCAGSARSCRGGKFVEESLRVSLEPWGSK